MKLFKWNKLFVLGLAALLAPFAGPCGGLSVLAFAGGCDTLLRGRTEAGVGTRQEWFFYTEAKRSSDVASASVHLKALVNHLVDLGLVEPDDRGAVEEALAAMSESEGAGEDAVVPPGG